MAALPPRTRARLLRMLHGEAAASTEEHELNAIFLQITLAVMLIFMITFFLFMEKTGGEISRIDELKSQVELARREKLLHALERTADHYRIRYGLPLFLRIDPESGAKSFDLSGVIREGEFTGEESPRNSFRTGGRNAWLDYASPAKLAAEWEKQTLREAGEEGGLSKADQLWLKEQINRESAQIKREIIEVQTLASAVLLEYFAAHPEKISDSEIGKLLARINTEQDAETRQLLLAELAGRLKAFIRKELNRISDVPMLEELP